MRRQLSAYKFLRGSTGYWYHPRFHRHSTAEDLLVIKQSRRRRGEHKEEVHKGKSRKELKPKSAFVPTQFSRRSAPLGNVDINTKQDMKRHGDEKSFPETLYEMLSTLSPEIPHVIGWSEDGNAFFIDQSMFAEYPRKVKAFCSRKLILPLCPAFLLLSDVQVFLSSDGNFDMFRSQLSSNGFRLLTSGR